MKVLQVVTSVAQRLGGVAEAVANLSFELKKLGAEVDLITYDTGEPVAALRKAQDIGVMVTALRRPRNYIFPDRILSSKLHNIVGGYDIIHIHGMWQYMNWCAASVSISKGVPFVAMPHGCLSPWSLRRGMVKKKIAAAILDRRYLKRARRIIVTARRDIANVRSFGLDVPCSVVPIGVDMDEYLLPAEKSSIYSSLGLDPSRRIVLYMSRIAEGKGLDMLAEAWGAIEEFHNQWQLVIAGPGTAELIDATRKLFKSHSNDGSITFVGPVYGKVKYGLLKCSDLFILPSRSENFSLSIVEALAAGLPVICTKGSPWDEIDGRCGWWTEISTQGILSALRSACSLDRSSLSEMGKTGRKLVEDKYTWSRSGKELMSVYDHVLN